MLRDDVFPSSGTPPPPDYIPSTSLFRDFPPLRNLNNDNNLDDVFGSTPSSATSADPPADSNHLSNEPSDIPRLRSEHSTSGYRDGLAAAKNTTIQEGFDEGYSLGAVMGLEVGAILGLLEGIFAAVLKMGKERDNEKRRIKALLEKGRRELKTEEVFGTEWWGEDGIWKYEVAGEDGEAIFKEVVYSHPVIRKWNGLIQEEADRLALDLGVMERIEAKRVEVDEE